MKSLQDFLGRESLAGLTFLDIGNGSGLFSLAARRMGAKVHSFDYDPDSTACAIELKRRFYPDDSDWVIEQGSVLDAEFLSRLGTFDVVYSWGVLHHTGDMYQAFRNVIPLVRPGGTLFIAIYNDCGAVSDWWRTVKRRYCEAPRLLKIPYALTIIVPDEYRTFRYFLNNGGAMAYVRYWTNYQSARGMSRWHDWIDWIGGYPYECATAEVLDDFFAGHGFSLQKLLERNGIGCHEMVFTRADADGRCPPPLRFGHTVARRSGLRLHPPFAYRGDHWVAAVPGGGIKGELVLFEDGRLCPSVAAAEGVGFTPKDGSDPNGNGRDYRVVRAERRVLDGPFQRGEGHLCAVHLPDLAAFADNNPDAANASTLAVFEDGAQLSQGHAQHLEITKFGAGRYSHWGEHLLFATSDNSDPNSNGRRYEILFADTDPGECGQ